MSSFTYLHRLPRELMDQVWDQALLQEVEDRYVLVHRVSMKVLPHKNSTKSAILAVDKERRAYALKFYDVRLDVWTFDRSMDYSRELDIYFRYPRGLEAYIQTGLVPIAMYKGIYGPIAQRKFIECWWESSLRWHLHESVYNQLKRSPANEPGSRLAGTVYLSSEFDKFALSDSIQVSQPTRAWNVDLCVHSFLRKHERRVLGSTRDLDEYTPRHMTVRIPKQAMERICRVVNTYFVNGPEPPHVCGHAVMQERQWKLGSFKGATQLYEANMKRIPNDGTSFQASQYLVEWKRTGPNVPLPFICACGEADAEETEEGPSVAVASPDELS